MRPDCDFKKRKDGLKKKNSWPAVVISRLKYIRLQIHGRRLDWNFLVIAVSLIYIFFSLFLSLFDFPFFLYSLHGNRRRMKENLHLLIYMGGFFVLRENQSHQKDPTAKRENYYSMEQHGWIARARIEPDLFLGPRTKYPDPFFPFSSSTQTERLYKRLRKRKPEQKRIKSVPRCTTPGFLSTYTAKNVFVNFLLLFRLMRRSIPS